MAPGTIASPGTPGGPCAEACEHPDCIATRRLAESICHYCGDPIGYEKPFYWQSGAAPIHAVCLEETIERR